MAHYFAAQLVQYVVLNAHDIKFEPLMLKLRAVALAWGPATTGYEQAVAIINMIKEEIFNCTLTPARVWLLIKSIVPSGKHLTEELVTFMDNLENNAVLTYLVIMEFAENPTQLLTGYFLNKILIEYIIK